MLSIVKGISSFELKDELWSGALDTLKTITENDKLQDLMSLLEELYPEPVEITTINDLLWFEDDYIFKQLDMKMADEYACSTGPRM
jgi:hypothetical protein